MAQRKYVVRFVHEWSFYGKGEEAAFCERDAMGLQQKGYAMVLGLAEEVAGRGRVRKTPDPSSSMDNGIAAVLSESDDPKSLHARV